MPEFLALWLWYVLAFDAGVAVTALIVTLTVRARTPEEAVQRATLATDGMVA